MVNIAALRPWWLRLMLLCAIGLPLFQGMHLPPGRDGVFEQLAARTAYAALIWLLILLNVGVDRLLTYMASACVLALTTVLLGALFKRLLPVLAAGMTTVDVSARLATLFLTMMTAVPYALFAVSCFSAADLIARARQQVQRGDRWAPHIALALRMVQHVGEVFANLMMVWGEEHPARVLPRFKSDWARSALAKTGIVTWGAEAVAAWSFALLIHSLEIIPALVDDLTRVKVEPQ